MPIPTPAQFEALRVDGNADVCEVLQKYAAMVNLMADLSAGMFKADGTLSTDMVNLICASGRSEEHTSELQSRFGIRMPSSA